MFRQPTIKDVTDSENDEFNNDFATVDSVASSDDNSEFIMDSDDEDNILKEIQTDSELLAFALRLQKWPDG